MALSATIHRASVELSQVDRNHYAQIVVTVARHPSETPERMLVRLLALAVRHEDGIEFGRGVSETAEPDAWSRDDHGRIAEWIEVGQPDVKRLVKATRRADRVILFAYGRGARRWREAAMPELAPLANVAVCHIDDDFIAGLAEALDRTIRWSLTVSEGELFLDLGERSLHTVPEIWQGEPFR